MSMEDNAVSSQEAENAADRFSPLPPDISIRSIRRRLEDSELLITQFKTDDNASFSLAVPDGSGERKTYSLFPGVNYIVPPNTSWDGEVYMNPLTPSDEVPEESNIPEILDDFLSRATTRERIRNLVISVQVPGRKADEIIQEAVREQAAQAAYTHAEEAYANARETLPDEVIRDIVAKQISEKGVLQKLHESGEKTAAIAAEEIRKLASVATYKSQQAFIDAAFSGEDPSLLAVTEAQASSLVDRALEISGERVPYLRSILPPDSQSLAFSIDHLDPNDLYTTQIVTTYLPSLGWSLSIPDGACPQQAAAVFGLAVLGKLDQATFPHFSKQLQELIADGKVKIDRANNTVICPDASILRPGFAVFHGDDDVTAGLETMSASGNPLLNVFSNRIITAEKEWEKSTGEVLEIKL